MPRQPSLAELEAAPADGPSLAELEAAPADGPSIAELEAAPSVAPLRDRHYLAEIAGAIPAGAAGVASAVATLPETIGRLEKGVVGALGGKEAGEAFGKALAFVPSIRLGSFLQDNVIAPAQKWYTEETAFGQIEVAQAKVPWTSKVFDPTYVLRNMAAQVPQLALSMGSAGLAGTGASLLQQAVVPSLLQIGEVSSNLRQYEAEKGPISDLAFGVASLGGGLVGGALELAGAKGLMGQLAKFMPKKIGSVVTGKAGEALAEGLFEGVTESAQNAVSNFSEILAKDPPKSVAELGRRASTPTFWGEVFKGTGESFFLGAAIGLPIASVRAGQEHIAEKRIENLREKFLNDPSWALAKPASEPGRIFDNLPRSDEETVRGHFRDQMAHLSDEQFDAGWTFFQRFVNVARNATGIDASHWWAKYLTEPPGSQPSAQILYQQAQRGQLVATHNMKEEAIDLFLQLEGRVPGLSIAITRPDVTRTTGGLLTQPGFGPITLVFKPEAVDPQLHEDAVVYDRDWYSGTMRNELRRKAGPAIMTSDGRLHGSWEAGVSHEAEIGVAREAGVTDIDRWLAMSTAEKEAALATADPRGEGGPTYSDRKEGHVAYIEAGLSAEAVGMYPRLAPAGPFIDEAGEPITAETLAAAYDRRRSDEPAGPVRNRAAQRLGSPDEVRERARAGLTSEQGDRRSAGIVRRAVEKASNAAARLFYEHRADDGTGSLAQTSEAAGLGAAIADQVIDHFLDQMWRGSAVPSREMVSRALRQVISEPGQWLEAGPNDGERLLKARFDVTTDAIHEAILLARGLPTDYFEAKRWGIVEPHEIAGIIVDSTGMDESRLARIQALAERFGWDYRAAEVKIRPDSRLTDARDEMIFEFADRFFQRSGSLIKGSTDVMPDGSVLVKFFEGSDVSTLVHEGAHTFRQLLYAIEKMALPEYRDRLQQGLKALETWAGVKDSNWTTEAEERWATGTEQYLRSGKAPIPGLKGLFEQFKTWLRSVYDDLAAKELATFSPEVEEFFDTFVLDVPSTGEVGKSVARMREWKKQDRQAYETALALKNLPEAKARLQGHFDKLREWIALAGQERTGLGTTVEAQDELGRQAQREDLETTRASRAVLNAQNLVERLGEALGQTEGLPDGHSVLADPKVLDDWKAVIRQRVREAGFARPFSKKIGQMVSFLESEGEAYREALENARDAAEARGTAQAGLTQASRDLMRTRARVRLLVREMRKAADMTLATPAAERAEVLRLADIYYAAPAALEKWLNVNLAPTLERQARAILEAEATYRATIQAIAQRGEPDLTAGNAVDQAANELLQDRIRKDVMAAREVLRETGALHVLGDGDPTDIGNIMIDLTRAFRRSLDLDPTTPASSLSITERESALLMRGGMDATTEDALRRVQSPLKAVADGWRNLVIGVREAGQALVQASLAWNPMKALDPYTYDPNRLINRVWKAFGIPVVAPAELSQTQVAAARDAFVAAGGAKDYFEKIVSPAWLAAAQAAFPSLRERQLIALVRDFGLRDLDVIRRKYQEAAKDAILRLKEAEKAGDQGAIDEAKAAVAKANVRAQRAEGHVGVSRGGVSPRAAYVLTQIGGAFDAFQNAAVRAGLWGPAAFHEDYLPRIYRAQDVERARRVFKDARGLGGPNKHSFQRVMDTLVEAYIIEGLSPATLDVAFLVDQYGRSLVESVEKRRLVMRLQAVAPDLFEWVDVDRRPPSSDFVDVSRYVSHSLITGKPDTSGSRLYAHKVVATPLISMAEVSAFDKNPVLLAAKKVNGYLKRIQLSIDLYHLCQVTRVAMASGVYGPAKHLAIPMWSFAEAVKALDPGNAQHPLVRELIEQGFQVSAGDWARRAIHKEMEEEVLSKISAGARIWHLMGEHGEAMSRWMWEKYVPALKVLVAMHQLERLLANPKTKDMDRATLVRAAATVANDKFGGMAPTLRGRSQTMKDILTLALLAPDWLETRFRNVLGVVKKGPEGALWRDYWFGELPADIARGTKGGPPAKWATGYVIQGMLMTAAANALIHAAWHDDDQEKEAQKARGMNWFTAVIVPAKDRRGIPLHVSFFATWDYFTAFLNDIGSVAPLQRWYLGRQGPLARGMKEIVTGHDFAGRPVRPKFFSPETLGSLVDLSLPWLNNIFYGSAMDAMTGQDPRFSFARSIARTVGGHTASTYLADVQERLDYLVGQARGWNREASWRWEKWYYKVPVAGELLLAAAQAKARRHNAEVREFIREVQKEPMMQATLGKRFGLQIQGAFMVVPGEKAP